ncbi:TPA: hypothetical protein ACTXXA_001816 [Legionella anisa]
MFKSLESHKNSPVPCIIYKAPNSGDKRKMVVIDGTPYYQSTGKNSNLPSTWFPFVMVRGTEQLNEYNIPSNFERNFSILDSYSRDQVDHYIVKYNMDCIRSDFPDPEIMEILLGRGIPTKKTLLTSCRLNCENFDLKTLKLAGLNKKEISLAEKLFVLEANPEIIDNPDEVNDWLIAHGAKLAAEILSGTSHTAYKSYPKSRIEKLFQEYEDQLNRLNKKSDSLTDKGYGAEAYLLHELFIKLHALYLQAKEAPDFMDMYLQQSIDLINDDRPNYKDLRGFNYYFDKLISTQSNLIGKEKTSQFSIFAPNIDKELDKTIESIKHLGNRDTYMG